MAVTIQPQTTLARTLTERDLQVLEAGMLAMEQVDCPVTHHFGPGVYIREVEMPTGALVIGHHHRSAHLNVMLAGRMTLIGIDGSRRELVAPLTMMSQPGRKIAHIHETVRWQNVYATDETDVETLEAMLFDKSETFQLAQAEQLRIACDHGDDRDDFLDAIAEFGFDEEEVWAIASNEEDRIDLPLGSHKIMVASSLIHGKGLFATASFAPGEPIAPARIDGKRTIAGRYTNHAAHPNAEMFQFLNGDIDLIAKTEIAGCKGGSLGDEITIDYRQALSLGEPSCRQ